MEGKLAIAIRRYRESDADDVSAIVRRGEKDADSRAYGRRRVEEVSYYSSHFLTSRDDRPTRMYVLTLHDPEDMGRERIEACGAIAVNEGIGDIGEITGIAVTPSFQRLGLGRMVMEVLEKDARERKLKKIVLKAASAALGFYEILGFHLAGNGRMNPAGGYCQMEKDIS